MTIEIGGEDEEEAEEMLLEKISPVHLSVASTSHRRGGTGRGGVCCFSPISSPLWETLPVLYGGRKSIEVHLNDTSQDMVRETIPGNSASKLPNLSFDQLQKSDLHLSNEQKRAFGRYVARGAMLDEEYWTAAWLRAEAHYEASAYMRHVDSYKRKYSEKEFYALKRRCSGQNGDSLNCMCIVVVKKEDPHVKRTVLNSVVGTLDLSIRLFVKGEVLLRDLRSSTISLPPEAGNLKLYAYISNVCVSKFARRQGIATNMLHFATDVAASSGAKLLFIHVSGDNIPAQDLYKKIGFEMVERVPVSLKDRMLLMWKDLGCDVASSV